MSEEDVIPLDVDEAAAAPAPAPEPAPFGPDDVVPRFRTDLVVARGASPALFDVADPVTGRKFTLYEFELAVARMLDGRRKVSEVVKSGGRLGVPMDANALYKFVRQLWHYGFLAAPAAAEALGDHGVGEAGSWEAREAWSESTRTLFETGQRLMRLGRNADAAGYFEAVLDGHPGNAEATEMLALIARGQSIAAGPLGADRAAPAAAPGAPGPDAPAAAPRRRRWPLLAVAAVAAVAVAAGGAAVVLGRRAPPPAPPPVVAAPAPAPPVAPPVPAAPAWRAAHVDRRFHPALGEITAPGAGELLWTASADAAVTKGEQVGELQVETRGKKDAALAKHIADLQKLAAEDPVYRPYLKKAQRDAVAYAARRRTRALALVAPATGVLSRAADGAGRAQEGERLARVVDPAVWQLAAVLPGQEPSADAACEVAGDAPGDRAPCRIVARTRGEDRTELIAELATADAPWIGRAAALALRIGPGGSAETGGAEGALHRSAPPPGERPGEGASPGARQGEGTSPPR